MRIVFAPEAEADLRELLDYVAERNLQAAVDLEERIFEVVGRLAVREMEGPEQRLLSGEMVKSWPVPPVRIYYQRTRDVLSVVRVYHQSRRPHRPLIRFARVPASARSTTSTRTTSDVKQRLTGSNAVEDTCMVRLIAKRH